MKKIKPHNKKDKKTAIVAEKLLNKWCKNNPEMLKEINDLCVKVVLFNMKWGTTLLLT